MAISADGKTLASGNGRVTLWDVTTGQRLKDLSSGDFFGDVNAFFFPDGTIMASEFMREIFSPSGKILARISMERISDEETIYNIIIEDFSHDLIPPSNFDLKSPANGSNDDGRPWFVWNPSDDEYGLFYYQLWIDGNLSKDYITSTSSSPPKALSSGLHTWTVKAVDGVGNVTQANQTWSIRVDGDAPAPFALVAPDDNFWTTDPFLNLAWQASSDAESGLEKYQIFMDDELFKDNLSPETTSFGPGDIAFAEDFESGLSKWNLSGSWDLTVALNHSGDYGLTSNPKEEYTTPTDAYATLAVDIDLAAVESATLKFWHRYILTRYYEYGYVEISTDGGRNWTELGSYAGYQEDWTQVAYSLDEYTGSRYVRLRLRLQSASGGTNKGWYIDDIEIVSGDSIPEGEHTWYVVAYDKLGNQTRSEQTRSFQIFIDNTPPGEPNLLSPSSAWTQETKPDFSWEPVTDEGIGLGKYQFWLDGELFFDDLSETQVKLPEENALTNGEHTWYVRAIDKLGNASQSTSGKVRIDLLPPEDFSLRSPKDGEIVTIPTPEFSWQSARDFGIGIDYYELWLNDELVVEKLTKTTAYSPTPFEEGKHTWYVKVFDKFGYERQSNKTFTFITEWSPPEKFDLISPADKEVVQSPRPKLTWEASSDAGTGIAKYQLWIGGQLNRDNIPPTDTFANPTKDLPNGAYNWFVKAFDEVGNVTPSTSTFSFTVEKDTTPPISTITSPANGAFVPGKMWELVGTADDGKGSGVKQVQVSLDGGNTWLDAESTGENFSTWKYTCTDYTDGEYTWTSRAIDNAGNISETSSEVTVKVDLTPPKPRVTVSPSTAGVGDITVRINFTVSEGSGGLNLSVPPTVTWTPYGGEPKPVVQTSYSGATWTGRATITGDEKNGKATISVSGAKDKLNNVMLPADDSASFVIDTIPPGEFDLVSPPNKSWLNTKRPTLKWSGGNETGSGISSYQLTLDDKRAGSTGSTSITPSADLTLGEHIWTVKAIDRAGNERLATSRWKFNIDLSKPVTHIEIPRDEATIGGKEFTIQGTSTDGEGVGVSGVTKVEISVNDGEWQPATSTAENFSKWTFHWTGYQTGQYTFRARATDLAGNMSEPGAPVTVSVDLSPPIVTTVTVTPELTKAGTVTVTIEFKTNESGLNLAIAPEVKFLTKDGKSYPIEQTSYKELTFQGQATITDTMANGIATIEVSKATDNYGNKMKWNKNAGSFVIDTLSPKIDKVSVTPDPAKAGEIAVVIMFADASDLDATKAPIVTFIPAGAKTPLEVTDTLYDVKAKQWKGTAIVETNMPDGKATIQVSGAVDAAGNQMVATDDAGEFVIDVTPPSEFNLVSPETEIWTRTADVTFAWTPSTDEVSGLARYQLILNGNVHQEELSPDETSFAPKALLDGKYTWKVVAFDIAGNSTSTTQEWVFQVDNASPQTTISVGEPSRFVGKVLHVKNKTPFTLDADDGDGSGVLLTEYRIDEGDWVAYTESFTVDIAGQRLIQYRSKDKAGNLEDVKTLSVYIESEFPWDVNNDGRMDISDLVLVGRHLGEIFEEPISPNPDVNGDGVVDISDLTLIGKHFSESTETPLKAQ